jgi:hypothetical protein
VLGFVCGGSLKNEPYLFLELSSCWGLLVEALLKMNLIFLELTQVFFLVNIRSYVFLKFTRAFFSLIHPYS